VVNPTTGSALVFLAVEVGETTVLEIIGVTGVPVKLMLLLTEAGNNEQADKKKVDDATIIKDKYNFGIFICVILPKPKRFYCRN
jgi:hypothetical protein